MLHAAGDFLDVHEENFCQNREYPFASDLMMLADMSCGLGYDGAQARMDNIRDRYSAESHLVVGINAGEKRVLQIKEKIDQLLA